MCDLNLLFRNRIGIPQNEVITFQNLDKVLEKTAKTIPFENLCIIENRTKEITKEYLRTVGTVLSVHFLSNLEP